EMWMQSGNKNVIRGASEWGQCTWKGPPAQDKRGVNLRSEALPFSRLWYDRDGTCHETPSATRSSTVAHTSHDSCLRCAYYVIETHEHTGEFGNGRYAELVW